MFSTERADWLTAQYVWAMQSDSRWAHFLAQAVKERNFAKFRRHCGAAVTDIKQLLEHGDKAFSEADRTFVVLTVWEQMGGDMDDMSNDHLFYVERAAQAGIAYKCNKPGRDFEIPASINPHEQDRMMREIAGVNYAKFGQNPCGEIPMMRPDLDHGAYSPGSFHNHFAATNGQKEKIMSNPNSAVAFEVKTYIFGQDVKDMTEAQLIEAIKKLEQEIAKLKEVKSKSTKIAAKIKAMETSLASIVDALDAT